MSGMLIIDFERSGGFAGIPVKATFSDQVLNEDELNDLRHLIENSDFLLLKNSDNPDRLSPDQFLYKISVVTTVYSHSVSLYEQEITPGLRPLIRLLLDIARRSKH